MMSNRCCLACLLTHDLCHHAAYTQMHMYRCKVVNKDTREAVVTSTRV